MRLLLKASLVGAAALMTSGPAGAAETGGWQTLFDGTSLNAFRCYNRPDIPAGVWAIEEGALKTLPGAKPQCDLITREKYKDFELEIEWKVPPGGNSGIIYRLAESPDAPAWHTGPEMQILDDAAHRDGQNAGRSAGALYDLIAPADKTVHPAGQWNKARIVAKGGHVEHWLNGKKVLEYEWGSPHLQTLISRSKFKDMAGFARQPEGHIAIQHHGEEAWFRNIRVRRL